MESLRTFLLRHRALAVLLLAATLCFKFAVPTGWMPEMRAGAITIAICTGMTDAGMSDGAMHGAMMSDGAMTHGATNATMQMPMKDGKKHPGDDGKSECPFAAASFAATGADVPYLLALAIAFIIALGFAAQPRPAPVRASHVRPPLRGPPLTA